MTPFEAPLLVLSLLLGAPVAPVATPLEGVESLHASTPLQDPEPFRDLTLEQARKTAVQEQKAILAYFWGDDCRRCTALEEITFQSPKGRTWLAGRVVAVRLGPDAQQAREAYSVEVLPSVLFLDAAGEELDRIEGYEDPTPFFERAEEIIGGEGGLERARRFVEERPDDPQAHLALARALKYNRRALESLEQYLWVFDHTRGDPEWEAVRMGDVLRELKLLARGLSQAIRALSDRRDRAAATLLEGYDPETPEAELVLCARELKALNGPIGQLRHTFFAWEVLRKREGFPKAVTDVLFEGTVESQLLVAKRYDDLLWSWGDPLVLVEQALAELHAKAEQAEKDPDLSFSKQAEQRRLAAKAGSYYEALLGLGREEEAAALAELLLAFEADAQSFIALVNGAKNAGRVELAEAFVERGLASLPEGKELERFKLVTRRLLRKPD